MGKAADRKLDLQTMLSQVTQVVMRGKAADPPAFTLVLGAGASFGVVPTASQMLGLPDRGAFHRACIPAFLHERESGAPPRADDLEACVRNFWDRLATDNKGKCTLTRDGRGLPLETEVPGAYKFLFSQDCVGGLNSSGEALDYIRHVTLGKDGRVRLNGTHFFLASLLSLQNRVRDPQGGAQPPYVGRRPFARTIFTTNFDPLLQVSLQLFHNLYYMTDRPEQLASDALHTDEHPALHLFYAHGSVHRPGPKNTDGEIAAMRELNAKVIAPYFATHGVIVLGYSGWDDCLLRALDESTSFRHNLYWLVRGETAPNDNVLRFLERHPNAFLVPITDGGDFMAALHRRLCPGMAMTELLANPILPLRERLERVSLKGIEAAPRAELEAGTDARTSGTDIPITPEEMRMNVLKLLENHERQFARPSTSDAELVEVQKLEHQADLAYSNDDWQKALELYEHLVEHPRAKDTQALALFRRAVCHGEMDRAQEAIAGYSRVIELPGAPAAQVAKALFNRGFIHRKAGRTDEAIADYSRAIDLPVPADLVARALFNRAVAHGKAGRVDQEIADYSRAIDLRGAPADEVARSLFNRAIVHGQAKRVDNELADYSRVIELPGAPAHQVARALVNRGVIHDLAGRIEEAIADQSRVIELPGAPVDQVARAHFNRGIAYENAGEVDKAKADYLRALELPGAPTDITDLARHARNKLEK